MNRRMVPLFLLMCFVAPAHAAEPAAQRACRSVHLRYDAPAASAFYNEVTVERSAPGTYFCVCGWDAGYFGIQELGDGRKLVIFSVWDSNQNDPRAVGEERRVKLLYRDEKVRTGRFGGEGTGGQSFFDYDWNIGDTYRLLVTARRAGDRTEYAGYFFVPQDKAWKHLVTFSTLTPHEALGGYYSFVEDFRRDGDSARRPRSARFGNTWVKPAAADWQRATKARFTADNNPATNIDASAVRGRFRLSTGGDTRNDGARLGQSLSADGQGTAAPADLPAGS